MRVVTQGGSGLESRQECRNLCQCVSVKGVSQWWEGTRGAETLILNNMIINNIRRGMVWLGGDDALSMGDLCRSACCHPSEPLW